MAMKKATSTPASARIAPTAARRTSRAAQQAPSAAATAPESATALREAIVRLPGSGVELTSSYADSLYQESQATNANPWPAVNDVAGYGKLIAFGVAAAEAEEKRDGEEGDGFHSSTIGLALVDSPAYAAAREKFRRDDHPNLHLGAGAKGADLDEYDAPLRELCATFFQAGLLAAGRPQHLPDGHAETPTGWEAFSAFDIGLAEAAAFEATEDGKECVYMHACQLERSVLGPMLTNLLRADQAAEKPGYNLEDDGPAALQMFASRMMRVGIVLARREAGQRNAAGDLLWDSFDDYAPAKS